MVERVETGVGGVQQNVAIILMNAHNRNGTSGSSSHGKKGNPRTNYRTRLATHEGESEANDYCVPGEVRGPAGVTGRR